MAKYTVKKNKHSLKQRSDDYKSSLKPLHQEFPTREMLAFLDTA
jgi:hypothetical protein